MATIYDLIELTSIQNDTTYSAADGSLVGVVDNVQLQRGGVNDNDGEFDIGDALLIGGVSYTINRIQEPSNSGRFILADGTNRSFDPGSESNLSVVFLTVSSGSTVRYFIIPNDSYGDLSITGIRTGGLNDVAGSDAAVISTADNSVRVVCFLRGTQIATAPGGEVAVECLKVGDWVETADHGPMQIRWIGLTSLDHVTLAQHPKMRPIRIGRGVLGPDRPDRDLYLSPQHRVLVKSQIARRLFGDAHVLLAVKHLVGLRGIDVHLDTGGADYFHILLDSHEIIFANGAACETLFLGAEAVKSVGDNILRDLPMLPEHMRRQAKQDGPCRPLLSAQQARTLVASYSETGRGFLQAGSAFERRRLRAGSAAPGLYGPQGAIMPATSAC